MRIFWWQGGLHAEPENDDERKALALIYEASRKTDLASESSGGKETAHRVVGNLKLYPGCIRTDLLHE